MTRNNGSVSHNPGGGGWKGDIVYSCRAIIHDNESFGVPDGFGPCLGHAHVWMYGPWGQVPPSLFFPSLPLVRSGAAGAAGCCCDPSLVITNQWSLLPLCTDR